MNYKPIQIAAISCNSQETDPSIFGSSNHIFLVTIFFFSGRLSEETVIIFNYKTNKHAFAEADHRLQPLSDINPPNCDEPDCNLVSRALVGASYSVPLAPFPSQRVFWAPRLYPCWGPCFPETRSCTLRTSSNA